MHTLTPQAAKEKEKIHRIAAELATRLRALLGDRLVEVRLYGSWARGDAAPDSDVDLAVLVQKADPATWQTVQEEAARLSLEHDLVLSVHLLSQEEWEDLQRLQTLYARRLEEEGISL